MNQYITYIALAVEIITAMIIVAQTKKKTVPIWTAIPTMAAFITFHATWIINADKNDIVQIVTYSIGTIMSIVFMTGTMIATTGCLEMKEGRIVFNTKHPLTRFIIMATDIVPVKQSICGASWAILAVIVFAPLIIVVLGIVLLFTALWVWQNPWKIIAEDRLFECKMKKSKSGWPMSPTPYLIAFTIITSIIYLVGRQIQINNTTPTMTIVTIVAAALIILTVGSTILANKIIKEQFNDMPKLISKNNNTTDEKIILMISAMKRNPALKPISIWPVIALMFTQNNCPIISKEGEEE